MLYILEGLVSSGESFPYKMGIRIFPHNQSRWIKSVLVGHAGDPDYILGLS